MTGRADFKAVPDTCPKCGRQVKLRLGETAWATVKYEQETDVLVWTCRECGFTFQTPPRDARDPLQGWTP